MTIEIDQEYPGMTRAVDFGRRRRPNWPNFRSICRVFKKGYIILLTTMTLDLSPFVL